MEKKIPIFLAGLIPGCLIGAGVMMKLKFAEKEISILKNYSFVNAGGFLDTDRLVLNRGDILIGQIISEDRDRVMFSYGNSTVEFRRDEIKEIYRNFYTRYLKAAL